MHLNELDNLCEYSLTVCIIFVVASQLLNLDISPNLIMSTTNPRTWTWSLAFSF